MLEKYLVTLYFMVHQLIMKYFLINVQINVKLVIY